MLDSLLHSLNTGLASGFWGIVAASFLTGIVLSLNPCMAAMLPLAAGSSRQGSYSRLVQFSCGFILTLISLGFLAAGFGKVLSLPGSIWTISLGVLYLVGGLVLLRVKLPVKVAGFYIGSRGPGSIVSLANKEGLNPFVLGILFGLAPSPCTVPVVLAVGGFVLASGKVLLGGAVLGAFGLGHSIPLALTFLPAVRKLFRPNRFSRAVRPALGLVMLGVAAYFLFGQPDFFDHSTLKVHNHGK